MAHLKFDIPQSLIDKLNQLENISDIAPKMIEESIPILKKTIQLRVKQNYSFAGRKITFIRSESLSGQKYGEYTQSGALYKSIKASKVKKSKNGVYWAKVYFSGKDKNKKSKIYPDGIPNSQKAAFAEFGRTSQVARPFMDKAIADSRPAVLAKMNEVMERELNK